MRPLTITDKIARILCGFHTPCQGCKSRAENVVAMVRVHDAEVAEAAEQLRQKMQAEATRDGWEEHVS